MTITTVLQGGLHSRGCPDVLKSVDGCGNHPLSKAGRLVQQWPPSPSPAGHNIYLWHNHISWIVGLTSDGNLKKAPGRVVHIWKYDHMNPIMEGQRVGG